MKLFKVETRLTPSSTSTDYSTFFVVAINPERAYSVVRAYLDKEDLGFRDHREMRAVHLLAEDISYPECRTRLLLSSDVEMSFSEALLKFGSLADELPDWQRHVIQGFIGEVFEKKGVEQRENRDPFVDKAIEAKRAGCSFICLDCHVGLTKKDGEHSCNIEPIVLCSRCGCSTWRVSPPALESYCADCGLEKSESEAMRAGGENND